MEAQLRAALGTKVIFNRKTPQKGKIEIEYYSSEELERLYDLLRILKQN
jgi:ParB family chromosome partitioning protein